MFSAKLSVIMFLAFCLFFIIPEKTEAVRLNLRGGELESSSSSSSSAMDSLPAADDDDDDDDDTAQKAEAVVADEDLEDIVSDNDDASSDEDEGEFNEEENAKAVKELMSMIGVQDDGKEEDPADEENFDPAAAKDQLFAALEGGGGGHGGGGGLDLAGMAKFMQLLQASAKRQEYNPVSVISGHGRVGEAVFTGGMERPPHFEHTYRARHNSKSFEKELAGLGWDVGMHSIRRPDTTTGDYAVIELLHGFPNPNPNPLATPDANAPPAEFALFCIVRGATTPAFSSVVGEEIKSVFDSLFTKGSITDVDDPVLKDLQALLGNDTTVQLKSPRPGQVKRVVEDMLKRLQTSVESRLTMIIDAISKRGIMPDRQDEMLGILSSGVGLSMVLVDLQTRTLYSASLGAADTLMRYEGEPIFAVNGLESFDALENRIDVRAKLKSKGYTSTTKEVQADRVIVHYSSGTAQSDSVEATIERRQDAVEGNLISSYRYVYGEHLDPNMPFSVNYERPACIPRPAQVPSGTEMYSKKLTDVNVQTLHFESTKKLEFLVVISENVMTMIEKYEMLKILKEDSFTNPVPTSAPPTTTTTTTTSANRTSSEKVNVESRMTRLDVLFEDFTRSEAEFSPEFDAYFSTLAARARTAAMHRVETSLDTHAHRGAAVAAKELAIVADRYRMNFKDTWHDYHDIAVMVAFKFPSTAASESDAGGPKA